MKSINKMVWTAVAVIALGGLTSTSHATIYNFQAGVSNGIVAAPSYTIDDVGVLGGGNAGNNFYNYAGGLSFIGGSGMTVLRFDISAVPSGETVKTATLTMWVQQGNPTPQTGSFSVYALPAANTDWLGTTATYDNQNQTGPVPWKLSNGNDAADFAAALSGATEIGSLSDISVPANSVWLPLTFTLDASVVEQWMSDPSGYAGLAIEAPSFNGLFAAENNATTSLLPLLELDAIIPEPGVVVLLGMGAAVLWFRRRQQG